MLASRGRGMFAGLEAEDRRRIGAVVGAREGEGGEEEVRVDGVEEGRLCGAEGAALAVSGSKIFSSFNFPSFLLSDFNRSGWLLNAAMSFAVTTCC
jgi:hypothetical protein